MSVYVDPLVAVTPAQLASSPWRWRWSCHLVADTLDELHAFAAQLGLRRSWFQDRRKLPHYDLTPGMRRKAVAAGAVELSIKDMMDFRRRRIRRQISRIEGTRP